MDYCDNAYSLPLKPQFSKKRTPLESKPFPDQYGGEPAEGAGEQSPGETAKSARETKLSDNPSSLPRRESEKVKKRENLVFTEGTKRRSRNPFDVMVRILALTEENDPHVLSMLYQILLKCDPASYQVDEGEFKYCILIITSMRNCSEKTRFRVRLSWTGLDVKREILKYYEIPVAYQTIFINTFVISDSQTLKNCNFQENNQIIHSFLAKKKIAVVESPIAVGEFLPRDLYDDVTSDEKLSPRDHETQSMDEDLELLRHQESTDFKTSSKSSVRHNEEPDLSTMMDEKMKLHKESGYFSMGQPTLVCDGVKKKTDLSKKRRKKKKNKRN